MAPSILCIFCIRFNVLLIPMVAQCSYRVCPVLILSILPSIFSCCPFLYFISNVKSFKILKLCRRAHFQACMLDGYNRGKNRCTTLATTNNILVQSAYKKRRHMAPVYYIPVVVFSTNLLFAKYFRLMDIFNTYSLI